MGLNLPPNPVLATDATGWTFDGSVPVKWSRQASLTHAIGIGGVTTGARFYSTNEEAAVYIPLLGPLAAVEVGETYTVSAYDCGVSATPLNVQLGYVRYNALGVAVEYVAGIDSHQHTQGVWQRLQGSAVMPAGTAYIGPLAEGLKQTGNTFEMSCFKIELGTPATDWDDGSVVWTASLFINDDDSSTDDNDVTLTIACEDQNGDPPDQMRFAEDAADADEGDVVWGAWEAYATTKAWQLAAQTDEAAHARGVGVEFRHT
jgi:hypothetical protein